jgi:hypothetical protein
MELGHPLYSQVRLFPEVIMKTAVLISGTLVGAFVSLVASRVPIVQVRDLPNAPSIDVVGWEPGEAQFGLRTRLRRDGSLLGAGRGDHRLFLSSVFVDARGGFKIATAHTGKVLRKMEQEKDVDACRFGNVCSPAETVGLAVSDELLRENRDSLVLTFRPETGRNWSIRLEKPLIDAYVVTLDSVSASLKKE